MPSPMGEGLTGHGHIVISSVSREIPCGRNETEHTRTIQILVRRGSLPHQPNARGGSPPRNPPREKREQSHTFTRILARGGSPPSVAGATVSASARFSRYGYAYAQNDKL